MRAWLAEFRERIAALPPNLRGAFWILGATMIWSSLDVTVKLLGRTLDPFQMAFFRCLFGGMAILPFVLGHGLAILRTRRPGGHLLRTIAGYFSMGFSFYAVTYLPLAEATAISFTRSLFMVPLAVIFLNEIVRWRRWSATAVGFLGVLIVTRPFDLELQPATFIAIAAAACVAIVGVSIKQLSTTERPETIIFYFGAIGSLLALGPALMVWRTPTLLELGGLLFIGAFGSLGQYCTVRGLRLAEATAVDPVDYTRLIFSVIFGLLIFAEWPDVWTFVGSAVIIGSTLYITRREARLRRTAVIDASRRGTPPG